MNIFDPFNLSYPMALQNVASTENHDFMRCRRNVNRKIYLITILSTMKNQDVALLLRKSEIAPEDWVEI